MRTSVLSRAALVLTMTATPMNAIPSDVILVAMAPVNSAMLLSDAPPTPVNCAVTDWEYTARDTNVNRMHATRKITVNQIGNGQKCPDFSAFFPCFCDDTDWVATSSRDSSSKKHVKRSLTGSPLPCTDVATWLASPKTATRPSPTGATEIHLGISPATRSVVVKTPTRFGGACDDTHIDKKLDHCPPEDCTCEWSAYSDCDQSGTATRSVVVTNPVRYGGVCNTARVGTKEQYCPSEDCEWEWSAYSDCDNAGTATRTVVVSKPTSYNGACNKAHIDTRLHHCPAED